MENEPSGYYELWNRLLNGMRRMTVIQGQILVSEVVEQMEELEMEMIKHNHKITASPKVKSPAEVEKAGARKAIKKMQGFICIYKNTIPVLDPFPERASQYISESAISKFINHLYAQSGGDPSTLGEEEKKNDN